MRAAEIRRRIQSMRRTEHSHRYVGRAVIVDLATGAHPPGRRAGSAAKVHRYGHPAIVVGPMRWGKIHAVRFPPNTLCRTTPGRAPSSVVDGSSWRLFDRVAADYDEVVPFFAEYGAAIVAALDPQPGCHFLDLGAGRGALTAPALAQGCVVTAVDAAPAMIGRLAASYPAARACLMNVHELGLAADSFGLVAASFVIHVLDDPAAGVAEAYRVLAPGGRFAFTGGSAWGRPAHAAKANGPIEKPPLGARLDALFEEFASYLPPGGSMGQPVDAADLLTDAGFVDLREDHAEVAVRFPDNETLWRWAMSHGYRAFIEDLPEEHCREFRTRVLDLPADDRILRRATGVWSGRKP
jgi:SAM-dependent methyltransferase